jgi:signal transduction histidine kinase
MRRRTVVAALVLLAGTAVVGARYGIDAGLKTLAVLAVVSALAIAIAFVVARRPAAQSGSLTHQLAVAVWIAVGAILIAVWAGAGLMFISDHDALLVSVMAAVIAVVGASVSGELLVRAANAMLARLTAEREARAAAEDARRRLIVAVSHDLRTPIASLRLLAEAVEDKIATGEVRTRYLREMQTHVAVLSALVEDLFDYARLEAGEIQLSARELEVGELVSETAAAMQVHADERGVVLRAEPLAGRTPGESLAARGDREQIRRVLLNLLDNAIAHTPAGGTVRVSASGGDGTVEVEVADEGSGIAPEERDHVFEAFYRGGDDASRSRDGAGLGLSIARAIVHAHGGDIWLAPATPGTRVRFTLPAEVRSGRSAAENQPPIADIVRAGWMNPGSPT